MKKESALSIEIKNYRKKFHTKQISAIAHLQTTDFSTSFLLVANNFLANDSNKNDELVFDRLYCYRKQGSKKYQFLKFTIGFRPCKTKYIKQQL